MESRGPGRPTSIDTTDVARVAARLFDEHGYDAVSMTDVAAAAGVSRRSLFLYFPTKPDLLWSGFEPFVANLRRCLHARASEAGSATAIADSLSAAFEQLSPAEVRLARSRLRVVAGHPETSVTGRPMMNAVRGAIFDHLRALERPDLDDFTCQCLAGAVTSAAFDATLRWATSDEGSPRALTERALGTLAMFA